MLAYTCGIDCIKANSFSIIPENLCMIVFTVAEKRNLLSTPFFLSVDDSVKDVKNNSFSNSVHLKKTHIKQTCFIDYSSASYGWK